MKLIPYEKLSKKERRKLDAQRRGSWNGLSPVTRMPPRSGAYSRAKEKQRSLRCDDASGASFLLS